MDINTIEVGRMIKYFQENVEPFIDEAHDKVTMTMVLSNITTDKLTVTNVYFFFSPTIRCALGQAKVWEHMILS